MAALHALEEAPANMVVEVDTAPHWEESKQGLGCLGVVLGFTLASILIFFLLVYPHYNASHAWVFWIVTIGLLLADALVIYLAVFVSKAVNYAVGKQ